MKSAGARTAAGLLALTAVAALACNGSATPFWRSPLKPPPDDPFQPVANTASPSETALLYDNPLKFVLAPERDASASSPATRLDVVLGVLHVQIPRSERARTQPLWNHLREDILDGATALRLRQNGFRVGIGDGQWWEAVQAVLDALVGVRVISPAPVRVVPNYPLLLELDTGPREQTLFFLADDGILTGETWPASRNVLRVSYGLDLQNPRRVRVLVVPEVRRRVARGRWLPGQAGLRQLPDCAGRAFAAAAFRADLEPGEFLLIAPSEQAELFGIIGGAFLASEEDGRRYDSYVFLRLDVSHVAQRN